MHNIYELEKRWLNYKIKSFIPHLSFFIIITIVAIIIFNLDINKINSKEETLAAVETIETKKTKQVSKPIEKIGFKEEHKVILTPSFDFIKKISNESTASYSSKSNREQKKQTVKKSKPKKPAKIYRKKVEQKTNRLNIQKQETQADIEHVIKRFKKNNNPALSLFVAKKYYRMGEYNKAYNYALLTNELNSEIDDSWLIFSRSLVKLGKKDKAIKVLTKYIEHSHSSNAKVLLDNITSGKFK